MGATRRALILAGAALLLAGLLLPWLARLPLGHLPGDITLNRGGMRVYIPVTTCLLISVIVSLVLRLLQD